MKLHKGVGQPRAAKQLTLPMRAFLHDLFSIAQGDPVKAYAMNFTCKNKATASANASRLLSNSKVRKEIAAMLRKSGIADEDITGLIRQGLKAHHPISYKGEVKKKWPDWSARHKFLQTLLELMDAYPSKKIEAITTQLTPERKEEIVSLLLGVVSDEAKIKREKEQTRVPIRRGNLSDL